MKEGDLNEGWAAWAGVAALVLILWERLSRRFTWWVLCRTLPYLANEVEQGLLHPTGRVKRFWMWFLSLLWPRQHRVFANELIAQFCGFSENAVPLPFDTEPVFLEARLNEKKRHERRKRRSAIRAHRTGYLRKRIKCATECGTRYGERQPGYWTTGVLWGWSCTDHDCTLVELHYCGRCSANLDGSC